MDKTLEEKMYKHTSLFVPKADNARELAKRCAEAARTHCKGDWVSASERLPTKIDDNFSDYVLVYHKGIGLISKGCYDYALEAWQRPSAEKVTHWQPLPTPPKEV